MSIYILVYVLFLLFVLVGIPGYVIYKRDGDHGKGEPLNLPTGSVRAILAIGIIGGFLITSGLGPLFIDPDYYSIIISNLATLSGGVTGFYFGSRNRNGNGKV